MAPILVYATTVMAVSMLDEAALSFLGMGVQPPAASLGNMLNSAQSLTVLTSQPWLWIPPGPVSYTHLDVYKRQAVHCL